MRVGESEHTGNNQIPFLTLQNRGRILLSRIIQIGHQHSLTKPLPLYQPPRIDVHSRARINRLIGEEHLGVLIGVERVAVDEEHGPDRWIGGHVKE